VLVSIITPTYNAERWLGETVESVLRQSWREWELILVDDGSSDSTVEVARRYMGPRVALLRQERLGAAAARNRGLDVAQGDFILFLDADDVLSPNKLSAQLARLASASPQSIASCAWGRFVDRPESARFDPEAVWRDLSPLDWIVTSSMGGGMMATAAWLIPRAVAERAGRWDASVRSPNDDGEYFTRVRLESDAVLFVEDARVYYRSGILGFSTERSAPAVAGLIHSLDTITANVLAREDSPRTRRAMAADYARFVYSVYPDHLPLVRRAERRIAELGGAPIPPPTGGTFGRVSRLVGWKAARRLQRVARRR
jgi:glycosyltransferase involved in cell wall biosynthesis